MTIFDAFTGWFAPILVHSQTGLYLVGYFRLGPRGTHCFLVSRIFEIAFYTLMAIQGGAIGAAFTLKFYALAPPKHQRSIHLLCILYIISIYSTIPICVTFLFLAYDRRMENDFWETIIANPWIIPVEWIDSAILYNISSNPYMIVGISVFIYEFYITAILLIVEMIFITYILNFPQTTLSRRTIQMQKQTFRILVIQFVAVGFIFGLPYITYGLARIFISFGLLWVELIEKFAIPILGVISCAHSGITSILVLLTTTPYRQAVNKIFRLNHPTSTLVISVPNDHSIAPR